MSSREPSSTTETTVAVVVDGCRPKEWLVGVGQAFREIQELVVIVVVMTAVVDVVVVAVVVVAVAAAGEAVVVRSSLVRRKCWLPPPLTINEI